MDKLALKNAIYKHKEDLINALILEGHTPEVKKVLQDELQFTNELITICKSRNRF